MSDELIKAGNSSFSKYEALLLRRDEIRKEAFKYDRAYVREFGELILKLFKKKLECIRLKKTIEYCQIYANRGESVNQDALAEYLKKELEEYNRQLKEMIEDHEAARHVGQVSEVELLKIKKIYHRVVKRIHPDINPAVTEHEELSLLWHRLVIAYNCNDLKEMEETEVLINAVLDKLGMDSESLEVPNIGEKIAELEEEIERIQSTDPYMYKFLLNDPDMIKAKKEELEKEYGEYEEYGNSLEEMLEGLMEGGMTFTWQMN